MKSKETLSVQIEGYEFCFNEKLLSRYAYVVGEPIADVESLRYEVLTFANTVSEAVAKYGLNKLTQMVEQRLETQIEGA